MNREQLGAAAPYLSIFGLGLLAGSIYVRTLPDLPSWVVPAMAIVGALLLLSWPLLRTEDVRALAGARQTRFGGNALLLIVAVLGIVVVLNYLGTLRYASWDVTENQRFSISNQTNVILDDIADSSREIQLTAVLQQGSGEIEDLERLMEQYESRAPNIDYRRLDPTLDRLEIEAFAQRLGEPLTGRELIAEVGTAEFDTQAQEVRRSDDYRREIVYSFDEQSITEALIKVTREQDKVVAFTSGHGEYALDSDPNGRAYSDVRTALEREGYTVETLALSTVTETIEADALAIVGPRQPFQDEEVQLLQDYLDDGGALIILLDPQTDVGLTSLLSMWGIRPRNDLVLDPASSLLGAADLPLIRGDGFLFHPITRDLEQYNIQVVLPGARSIDASGEPLQEGASVTPFLETSEASWGETNLAALTGEGAPPPEPGPEDASGPLNVAVAAEVAPTSGEEAGEEGAMTSRLVVFGSAGLASDGFNQQLGIAGNAIIVVNAVNWLTQDEELIAIPPTDPGDYPLDAPQSPWLLFIATAIIMPAVVAGLGFAVWWGRR